MRKKTAPGGTKLLRLLAIVFLVSGLSLTAEDKKLNIVELVKLQNPAFYAQLLELKNSGGPEAGAAQIDIPNGYVSNAWGTGAGVWGETYVVYYPEGRGALLAHTSVEPEKIVTEFFEHKNGKMVKIKSLLPALDCSSHLSAEALAHANKFAKKKNWVKKLHFIYKLPHEGTTITGSCNVENNGTHEMSVMSEAGVDSEKFSEATAGVYGHTYTFHWDKKSGTFKQGK
ncbi:MAG: hypothetical protein U1F27_15155 [Turneriella sp.]